MKKFVLLNVVCQPHPKNGYSTLFRNVGELRRGVQYYGERFATLSPISEVRSSVFTGRLATWIEPDRNAKTIDVSNLEERFFDDSGVVIPRGVGLNSRIFNFAFNVDNHSLVLELTNDEGQTISAAQGRKAIQNVLQKSDLDWVEEVLVFVKTKSDTVERFFSLPRIRRVEIDLYRPNADDHSDLEEEILREMEEENSKRRKLEITRAPQRDSLELSARDKAMANVAKDNGSVTVYGQDEHGDKVTLSTREVPAIIERGTEDDSGPVVARTIAESL